MVIGRNRESKITSSLKGSNPTIPVSDSNYLILSLTGRNIHARKLTGREESSQLSRQGRKKERMNERKKRRKYKDGMNG